MNLDSSIFKKIKRRAKELGFRYERVGKYGHWEEVSYWHVWFPGNTKRYLYGGYLHEIALKLGWITRDDLDRARGRTEIPQKRPFQPLWDHFLGFSIIFPFSP